MDNIIDLDILRPERIIVKLAGKEIDVSFIPTGITFDIDERINTLRNIVVEDSNLKEKCKGRMPTDDEKAKLLRYQEKEYDIAVNICSLFCSVKYEEMNEQWFRKNTSPLQVVKFADAIKDTLLKSYNSIEGYTKN